jgi:hypothetical protein
MLPRLPSIEPPVAWATITSGDALTTPTAQTRIGRARTTAPASGRPPRSYVSLQELRPPSGPLPSDGGPQWARARVHGGSSGPASRQRRPGRWPPTGLHRRPPLRCRTPAAGRRARGRGASRSSRIAALRCRPVTATTSSRSRPFAARVEASPYRTRCTAACSRKLAPVTAPSGGLVTVTSDLRPSPSVTKF